MTPRQPRASFCAEHTTAVTSPVCETVATLLLLELHVAVEVTSFFDPFDIVASADS